MADTTPTLREAAQQALEALERAKTWCSFELHKAFVRPECGAAITTLRAALAEQAAEQAEPVAVPAGYALMRTPITEEMHVAAAKVLVRANGLDGTPQRMLDAMIAAAPPAPARQEWQPIETAPKTGAKIIVRYVNRNNKPRTVMARWLTDEQAEETDADGVGLKGGWYECIDNWDDYTEVAIHEGEPSLWMHLPAAPLTAAPAEGGAT